MASDVRLIHDPLLTNRALGLSWIAYGLFRIVAAILIANYTQTATVMFGALLVRTPDPAGLMAAFHLFYMFLIVLSVICGVLGLMAGFALLDRRRSIKNLAVVAAFLSLSDLPLGLSLGVYTLLYICPLASRSLHESKAK
jgi:hypothetical protein